MTGTSVAVLGSQDSCKAIGGDPKTKGWCVMYGFLLFAFIVLYITISYGSAPKASNRARQGEWNKRGLKIRRRNRA
jgi:hypothetical protein